MIMVNTKRRLRFVAVFLTILLTISIMPVTIWAEADIEPLYETTDGTPSTDVPEETSEVGMPADNPSEDEGNATTAVISDLDVTIKYEKTPRTVVFSWESLSIGDDAVSYQLLINGDSVTTTFDTDSETGKVSTTYTFAKYNTTYKATVQVKKEDDVIASSEEMDVYFTDPTIKGLKSYSSYNSVDLEWTAIKGISSYNVYKDNKFVGRTSKNYYNNIRVTDEKTHTFKVVAVVNGIEGAGAATVRDTKFNAIKYKGTMRKTVKLTCWTKGHKKHKITIKKGKTIVFDEFSKGRYRTYYNGNHYINVKRIYLKNITAKGYYDCKHPYSAMEAQRYVNRRGISSKKSGLVFVSTRSQRIYLFQGSKGKWKIDTTGKYKGRKYANTSAGNWVISTGKSSTPTPTGITKYKYKWRTHHSLSYWSVCNTFSFHSKSRKWVLGGPKSGGCIRNEKEQAHYIYDKYKLGTTVVIY